MAHRSDKPAINGLTVSEKRIIRETWKICKRDLNQTGIVIFLIFFGEYPHNMLYFTFKATSISELEKQPLVKLHALRIMREMSFYIENLDKREVLLLALRHNALNHRKRRISKTSYDELRASFLKGFHQYLGAQRFKPEAAAAWDKALSMFFQVITDVNDDVRCDCPIETDASDNGTMSQL